MKNPQLLLLILASLLFTSLSFPDGCGSKGFEVGSLKMYVQSESSQFCDLD
jgi:hypothetical protein